MSRAISIIILVAIVFIAMWARWRSGHFECVKCNERFQISYLRYLFAPHARGRRYVTCPKCGMAAPMPFMSNKKS